MSGPDRESIRRVVREVLEEVGGEESSPAPDWSLPPFYRGDPSAPVAASQATGSAPFAVAIGSDHGGFALKRQLCELLRELRIDFVDVGPEDESSVDYPDFAVAVGRLVRGGRCRLGIMIDGAGIGSAMALNKLRGIRAATVHSEATAINSREHNDANVLVLGSAQMHAGHARRITRIWLATEHAGGRHARRVAKINALDGGRS